MAPNVIPCRPLGVPAACCVCIGQPAGVVGLHLLDSCPAGGRPMSYAQGKQPMHSA